MIQVNSPDEIAKEIRGYATCQAFARRAFSRDDRSRAAPSAQNEHQQSRCHRLRGPSRIRFQVAAEPGRADDLVPFEVDGYVWRFVPGDRCRPQFVRLGSKLRGSRFLKEDLLRLCNTYSRNPVWRPEDGPQLDLCLRQGRSSSDLKHNFSPGFEKGAGRELTKGQIPGPELWSN